MPEFWELKPESLLVFSIFGIHLTPLFAENQNFPQPDLVSPTVVMSSFLKINIQTNQPLTYQGKGGAGGCLHRIEKRSRRAIHCILRGLSANLLFNVLAPPKPPVFRDYLMSPIPEPFAVLQIGLLQGFYNHQLGKGGLSLLNKVIHHQLSSIQNVIALVSSPTLPVGFYIKKKSFTFVLLGF